MMCAPASAVALAQNEMDRIKTEFNRNQDKAILARELSELLRRISISVFPRTDTAALTGEVWLSFLDEHSVEKSFCDGIDI